MTNNLSTWHFSHEKDIETIYILWSDYKQQYLSSHADNNKLDLGIPQSLAYLQRRLNVTLDDLNNYSTKNYGHSFSGIDSINPESIGKGSIG
jgi:hypothetical protein